MNSNCLVYTLIYVYTYPFKEVKFLKVSLCEVRECWSGKQFYSLSLQVTTQLVTGLLKTKDLNTLPNILSTIFTEKPITNHC